MTSVPGFLTKTFEIFSTPEFADCCGWGQNGDTIIIRKVRQLIYKVKEYVVRVPSIIFSPVFSLD